MFVPRLSPRTVLTALGALLLVGCAGAAPPPSPAARPTSAPSGAASAASPAPSTPILRTHLRVPYAAAVISHLPFWLTYEAGLFMQYGLDVETDYIATSTVITQSLLAGERQLASSSEDATLSASLAGADLVIIAAGLDRMLFFVNARLDLGSPQGLRGGRLAITRLGAGSDYAGRTWLESVGLRPEQDVALVQAGGQPEVLAALQSGGADAGVLGPPANLLARRAGFPEVGDLTAQPIAFHQESIVTSRRFLQEQPAAARAFVQAFVEGLVRLRRDPALVKDVMRRYTGADDPDVLEEGYQALLRTASTTGRPSLEAIRVGLEHLAESTPTAASAPPEQFVDTTIIDALDREGFLARIAQ
jgi:NitT/TauT family transport system substrate-binding protein